MRESDVRPSLMQVMGAEREAKNDREHRMQENEFIVHGKTMCQQRFNATSQCSRLTC